MTDDLTILPPTINSIPTKTLLPLNGETLLVISLSEYFAQQPKGQQSHQEKLRPE